MTDVPVGNNSEHEQDCANFKAGNSTTRFSALDQSGIFGFVCARHETPLLFTDMFGGEK
jgi:hypothetical protein